MYIGHIISGVVGWGQGSLWMKKKACSVGYGGGFAETGFEFSFFLSRALISYSEIPEEKKKIYKNVQDK